MTHDDERGMREERAEGATLGLEVTNFRELEFTDECQIVRTGARLGAPAVSVFGDKGVMAELRALLCREPARPKPPDRVLPTPRGGISAEWYVGSVYYELEVEGRHVAWMARTGEGEYEHKAWDVEPFPDDEGAARMGHGAL